LIEFNIKLVFHLCVLVILPSFALVLQDLINSSGLRFSPARSVFQVSISPYRRRVRFQDLICSLWPLRSVFSAAKFFSPVFIPHASQGARIPLLFSAPPVVWPAVCPALLISPAGFVSSCAECCARVQLPPEVFVARLSSSFCCLRDLFFPGRVLLVGFNFWLVYSVSRFC
jgi:hypothetical protein